MSTVGVNYHMSPLQRERLGSGAFTQHTSSLGELQKVYSEVSFACIHFALVQHQNPQFWYGIGYCSWSGCLKGSRFEPQCPLTCRQWASLSKMPWTPSCSFMTFTSRHYHHTQSKVYMWLNWLIWLLSYFGIGLLLIAWYWKACPLWLWTFSLQLSISASAQICLRSEDCRLQVKFNSTTHSFS